MKNITIYFKDIDCAACALEVETAVSKLSGIYFVKVDYVKKKIHLKYDESLIKTDIIEYIYPTAKDAEDEIKLSYEEFEEEVETTKIDFILFFIGSFIGLLSFIISILYKNNVLILSIILYILSYLLIGYKIIFKCLKNIIKGKLLDENFLMVLSSICAFFIGEFIEGLLVMFLYNIGEYLQDKAVEKSTNQIKSLSKLKVDKVTLLSGEIKDIEDIKVNDVIICKVGERIPLDGVIIDGDSSLDISQLTGESIPVDVFKNDAVYSGSINLSSVLKIKVLKENKDSTTSKIIKLVEEASSKKSRSEEFISKFAKIYTPVVIGLAVIVFIIEAFFIDKFTINDSLNNAIVFLVSSCPCALIISIPLSMYSGIGKCSSIGILVKGGSYIEALSKLSTLCFDKTGTLTYGNFEVDKIITYNIREEELLQIASSIESKSNHPIAKAICKLNTLPYLDCSEVKEIRGYGISCNIGNDKYLLGNSKLLKEHNIIFDEVDDVKTTLYISKNNILIGIITIVDEIKKESYKLIEGLSSYNIKPIMLTGDKDKVASNVSKSLKIDTYYSDLLPIDKLNIIEDLIKNKKKNNTIGFIGDGINDTPALKLSDVGIAVGSIGNDEATEVADVVILSDKIDHLLDAIKISKMTLKVLIENVIFAILVKVVALVIGTLGILGSFGMILGVFADVGVCLIVVLNSLRILLYKEKRIWKK